MFASKLPPENTIKRIEELENAQKALQARLEILEKHPNLIFTDLKLRVEQLEKDIKSINELNYATRFGNVEESLKKLQTQVSGLNVTSSPVVTQVDGKIDLSPVLQRLQTLEASLETKANKE